MEPIIALAIVVLFAYWIGLLKHELQMTQSRLRLASQVSVAQAHSPSSRQGFRTSIMDPVNHEVERGESGGTPTMVRKQRETEGGIPTWTLG